MLELNRQREFLAKRVDHALVFTQFVRKEVDGDEGLGLPFTATIDGPEDPGAGLAGEFEVPERKAGVP